MDVLLAWLVERLGPRAVGRTAKGIAVLCAVATAVAAIALVVVLTRG
jgi:hypothetical protein